MRAAFIPSTLKTPENLPLVVDLDGTLCRSDTLIEAIFNLCRKNPLNCLRLPFWLLRGKAAFKHEVFSRGAPDPGLLPWNQELLDWLKVEHQRGRELILATGSPAFFATQVAEHLGLFKEVYGSDRQTNFTGSKKAALFREKYGERRFAYAGNALVDIRVWRVAGEGVIVNPDLNLLLFGSGKGLCPVSRVILPQKSMVRILAKAIRVHQWSKNLLIFVPVALGGKITDVALLAKAGVAFAAFSLVASSVYLLNDMLDLESDRCHPDNRRRPFAAGDLSLLWGMAMAPVLLVTGFLMAWLLAPKFLMVLAGYYVLTFAYSFYLKRLVLADIVVLAGLYTFRIFAGGVATSTVLTYWLLTFSGFLFLSLALVKRTSELLMAKEQGTEVNSRRGYQIGDISQLSSFGSAAGYLSILVFALYLRSPQVSFIYPRPDLLWFVCPFLLYWISRMWLKTHRGEMHSDPLVYAMKDRGSYVIIGVMALIWAVAAGYFL